MARAVAHAREHPSAPAVDRASWTPYDGRREGGFGRTAFVSAAGVEALLWTAVTAAGSVLALLMLAWYRRRMRRGDEPSGPVFTLEEIKRLRDRGEITLAEYEALRAKVLEQARR